jgi:hypothetical protein
MERYYFKTNGDEIDVDCTEPCHIKKGTMIGSVACQQCEHCKENNADYYGCSWIVCEKITEASQLLNKDQKAQESDTTEAK